MLDRLREWLDSHPNGRMMLLAAGVALLLVMVGVLIALNQDPGRHSDPGAFPTVDTNALSNTTGPAELPPQDPLMEPDHTPPEMVGEAPRRPRVAWINEKDIPAKSQPGLNLPAVKQLGLWEEVSWIQEDNNWDQVRLKEGQEVWVQSRYLTFTKPMNLDKPNPAELAVMAFYQAVARKDYAAAYSYLSPPWKAELSFDEFVRGYTVTVSLRTEIARVVQLGESRYQVDVSMIADEFGRDVPYLGSYEVEKEGEEWVMASGSLLRQGASRIEAPGGPEAPQVETVP